MMVQIFHKPPEQTSKKRYHCQKDERLLKQSGIDNSCYGVHRTHAASTSAQSESANNSIETIMKSAGWARESTIQKPCKPPNLC